MTTRIMVVDDEPAIGKLLMYQLRSFGYQVSYIQDGLLALQRFALERPDLVLLDVMMPQINGWEVCRQIRACSSAPVIMLTAKSADTDVVTGLGAGADDYIAKPFSIALLLDRVGVWMRTRQRLRAAQAQLAIERERSWALAEQAARDETVALMASTAADRLAQPLTVLRGRLELAKDRDFSPDHLPEAWPPLERAVADLTERLEQLRSAVRYVTHNFGDIKAIDLVKAHERESGNDSGQ